ncbi:MAG TPA: glycoside hydrolase family 44 protein [Rhizomicrobium sp.]|jgi:hypothetical protein
MKVWLSAVCAAALLCSGTAHANDAVTVKINALIGRHPINPLIYGVAFATPAELKALNAPLNRSGGNNMSTYNWKQNAQNLDADYFYESYPQPKAGKGQEADAFVQGAKLSGAQPMLTVPLIGWVAKLGPNRAILPSFSVKKYGAQCAVDPFDHDAGDGLGPKNSKGNCGPQLTGNDPNDAYVADNANAEQSWISHLIGKWGPSAGGGVSYYLMDNEPSIWYSTHVDVHPVGPHATEYRDKVLAMSAKIKALDAHAKVVAPEEWGWEAYAYSGYDQQVAPENGYTSFPDHQGVQGGVDYIPWLLQQWKTHGHPVDVVSVHFYPQGGEFNESDPASEVTTPTKLMRNRSTRQLWDPNYVSESWIDDKVNLIPRMKGWIASDYYAGTPVAITEYNWGAENDPNGATAQADIYGIFGQQGLDMATRWTTPDPSTPTFKAMQMYRNYDGNGSTFGDTSISAKVPNPDNLSAFAALRASDGAMTVMVISKVLSGNTDVKLNVENFAGSGSVKAYRLTAANKLAQLPPMTWAGGALHVTVPAESVTLYILPKQTD